MLFRSGAIANHVARELLRVGDVGDAEKVRYWGKMSTRTGQLERIFPGDVLHKVAVLDIQLRRDLPRRRVGVARHVGIDDAADRHARLAVGQVKLLYEPIAGVNEAIGIGVEEFLHHDRFPVGQAGNLQRDGPVIRVADGRRRDAEGYGGGRGFELLACGDGEQKDTGAKGLCFHAITGTVVNGLLADCGSGEARLMPGMVGRRWSRF